jgi:hypothetical protein
MSRERSIALDPLSATDQPMLPNKTHYTVTGECSNCSYRGAVQLPRGVSCPVRCTCPVECPNCGCENLTRIADDSYPPGLEAFVDKGIEDGMINPSSRDVALRRMSTIEGCCAMVRLVYLQGVSREREADLQRQRVQAELETVRDELAIWRAANQPSISAVGTGTGVIGYAADVASDDAVAAVDRERATVGGGSVSGDPLGYSRMIPAPSGGMVPRSQWSAGFDARRRAFGISNAEMERAYRDREIAASGITIIGGSVGNAGILASEAAVIGNNVADPLLTAMADQQAALAADAHARTWGLDIRSALANDNVRDNDQQG